MSKRDGTGGSDLLAEFLLSLVFRSCILALPYLTLPRELWSGV